MYREYYGYIFDCDEISILLIVEVNPACLTTSRKLVGADPSVLDLYSFVNFFFCYVSANLVRCMV